jgi:hypothetical protein
MNRFALLAPFGALMVLVASFFQAFDAKACSRYLQGTERLRREIFQANQKDQARRATSNFLQGRVSNFEVEFAPDEHVVSLGSGPDIFLPLYEFPHSTHYHLVDLIWGWGSPKEFLSEIYNRLSAIEPDAEVTLEAEGFAKDYSQAEWEDAELFVDALDENRMHHRESFTWKVRWKSKLGVQEKFFHLHLLNFSNLDQMQALIDSFGSSPLGGLVLTYVHAPHITIELFMNALKPQGVFVAQLNYNGPNPEDSALIEMLKKKATMRKTNAREVQVGPKEQNQSFFLPPLFTFRKR